MIKSLHAALLLALALAATPLAAVPPADGYILFGEGSRSITMNGSSRDIERARSMRDGMKALLFVRRDGQTLVIRDEATLRQAEAILKPQAELGRRQGELGARQGALGAKQGALGAQQARLGVQQVSASPERAEELGRQQEALGRQQEALGRQQDILGRQQDALGREQERISRIADHEMNALIEDAMKRGLAKRVD